MLSARWAAELDGEDDCVFSTASLWPLLAYLAAASDGPARGDLEQAVGVVADGAQALAAAALDHVRGSDAVATAAALWLSDDVALHRWWQQRVALEVTQRLSGNVDADQRAFDSWVRSRTGGLIDGLPGAITNDTLM